MPCFVYRTGGSSPRGRGKHEEDRIRGHGRRLIPAWAGKTLRGLRRAGYPAAHPRVGGENRAAAEEAVRAVGSSPRGRGKPADLGVLAQRDGLIPAWAGKTSSPRPRTSAEQAHPRVGGENTPRRSAPTRPRGSSPRGRGKRSELVGRTPVPGLIPAWAGKTYAIVGLSPVMRAHPRVGGENFKLQAALNRETGSSPRGRGKHFLTCAFIERIGQILETLELAVSSESYTLSAAYATDAPQDQARNTALVLPSSRGAS